MKLRAVYILKIGPLSHQKKGTTSFDLAQGHLSSLLDLSKRDNSDLGYRTSFGYGSLPIPTALLFRSRLF